MERVCFMGQDFERVRALTESENMTNEKEMIGMGIFTSFDIYTKDQRFLTESGQAKIC